MVIRLIRVKRVIMVIIVLRVLRVNYYQSAFNSQKEKLNILAEMLEISKSGRCGRCIIHHYYLSELIKTLTTRMIIMNTRMRMRRI